MDPCVHFCCLALSASLKALTEQLMSLWLSFEARKGTHSGLRSSAELLKKVQESFLKQLKNGNPCMHMLCCLKSDSG